MFRRILAASLFPALLSAGCASTPVRTSPERADRVVVIVKNESWDDVTAYMVRNGIDAFALGPVEAHQTRTFRVRRDRIGGYQLELGAFSRGARMSPLDVIRVVRRGVHGGQMTETRQYATPPFPVGSIARIEWQLSPMNTLSSLIFR